MNDRNLETDPKRLWMWPVSFAGLLRILHVAASYPEGGVAAGELDAAIRRQGAYVTQEGKEPARTTLYHCRNALLRLQALRRVRDRVFINEDNPHVSALLREVPSGGSALAPAARDAFASLVLANTDCRAVFFDLFMCGHQAATRDEFAAVARPVVWRRHHDGCALGEVRVESEHGERGVGLRSQRAIKSVLYGIRYWARDELALIDEFYWEGKGSVMYPIRPSSRGAVLAEVVRQIVGLCSRGDQWTTLSVRDLVDKCGQQRRRPLSDVFAGIEWISEHLGAYTVLIPTSRRFATMTARSPHQEELHLRGLFRDPHGRLISHVRLHGAIAEEEAWQRFWKSAS